MLYISIALVICFGMWCKFKPEITINHTYKQKYPDDPDWIKEDDVKKLQEEFDKDRQTNKDKKLAAQAMDQVIGAVNEILNGGDEDERQ